MTIISSLAKFSPGDRKQGAVLINVGLMDTHDSYLSSSKHSPSGFSHSVAALYNRNGKVLINL